LSSGCFWWGSHRNQHQVQSSYAKSLQPVQVAPAAPVAPRSPDPMRTMRVRVYADSEYRVQVLHWKNKLDLLMRRVNEATEPLFGVELEIVDAHPWERVASPSNMGAMLEELEMLDPGDDVDWVIGFVTQLSDVSSDVHQLGMARPMSRHFVLRGMNDAEELEVLAKVLDQLDADEREKLYEARKRHKELTVFLHEWGHTLGALHVSDPTAILNTQYDNNVHSFAGPNFGLMEIALRYRGRELTIEEERARDAALIGYLESKKNVKTEWMASEVDQMLAVLRAAPGAATNAGAVASNVRVSRDVTPSHRRDFHQALALASQGRHAEAWDLVFPLTEHYEDEAQVQIAGCRISAQVKQLEWPTAELCKRAIELAPDDPSPHLALARAQLTAKQNDAAIESLRAAHTIVDRAGDADHVDERLILAATYQSLGLVTWMESALDGVTGDATADEMRGWATQNRRRYGLPPSATKLGVAPEREGAYLEDVKAALSQVYAAEYENGRELMEAGRKAYPKVPGFYVVQCDLEVRLGKTSAALKACNKAIAIWDGSMWAHYLAGSITARGKRHSAAVKHLKRAIELDPEMQSLWSLLGKVYEKAGKTDELDALRAKYKQEFGKPL